MITSTSELQKQLKEALEPLKDHPEASDLRHHLEDYDIFSSFLPYKNDFDSMSEEEKEQQKYYKTFWIITDLLDADPSILTDEKNSALMQVRSLCYSKSNQLHALVDAPEKTEQPENPIARTQSPTKGHL